MFYQRNTASRHAPRPAPKSAGAFVISPLAMMLVGGNCASGALRPAHLNIAAHRPFQSR